jgi:hypothetical protein
MANQRAIDYWKWYNSAAENNHTKYRENTPLMKGRILLMFGAYGNVEC